MGHKIKLIWDFFGPAAEGTAKHHAIHLDEYAQKHSLETYGVGEEKVSEDQFTAYMIVDEKNMIGVRDALKPQRGELA